MTIDEEIEQFKYDAECNRADLDLSFAEDNDKVAEWLEELKQYRAIGAPKELKRLKENGAFTGIELAQIAIGQMKLKGYMEIGTPEECRAAVEKQIAKKPIEPDEEYGTFKCPNCGGLIFTENRFETHKHCLLCGQKLDWSDEE